jgi:hypothetical protein
MAEHSGERKKALASSAWIEWLPRKEAARQDTVLYQYLLGFEVAVSVWAALGPFRPRPHDPAETVVSIDGGSPLRP